MKDFAKKHPINKSKTKRVKTSLRAKRELNQPLKIKHLFIIGGISALLLFASNMILQTDVVNIRGNVSNPTIEIFFPIELEKDTVLLTLRELLLKRIASILSKSNPMEREYMHRSNSALCCLWAYSPT